jgi:hypothetical protein
MLDEVPVKVPRRCATFPRFFYGTTIYGIALEKDFKNQARDGFELYKLLWIVKRCILDHLFVESPLLSRDSLGPPLSNIFLHSMDMIII